jgi:hypothetical protein
MSTTDSLVMAEKRLAELRQAKLPTPKIKELKEKMAKPALMDFEVRYTTKDGNRGKTWVQAEDAQWAVSKAQKQFNADGTGEKVTSAIKSKMDLTAVTPEGKPITEPTAPSKPPPDAGGKAAEMKPYKVEPSKKAIDIEEIGKQKQRKKEAGFIATPVKTTELPERLTRAKTSILEKVVPVLRRMAVQEGAPKEVREVINQYRATVEMGRLKGKEAWQSLDLVTKSLSKTFGKESVLTDLGALMGGKELVRARDKKGNVVVGEFVSETPDTLTIKERGISSEYKKTDLENRGTIETPTMTIDQFARKYQLSKDSKTIKDLRDMVEVSNFQRAGELGQKLRESGVPEELAETVENNAYYTPQIYARWLLGEKFEPKIDNYKAAVLSAKEDILTTIDKITTKATLLREKTNQADIQKYFDTGDIGMLKGVDIGSKNSIEALRNTYLKYKDVVGRLLLDGDTYRANVVADNLESASRNVVNEYLDRTKTGGQGKGGGVDASHLMTKELGKLYADLYEPLTADPRARARATIETQENMLAGLALNEKMYNEWGDKYWAERYTPDKGFTKKLGDEKNVSDVKRYGKMTGKYLKPELYNFLKPESWHPSQRKNALDKTIYYGVVRPQALLREAMVTWHQTILRNEETNLIGWGSQTGDVQLPGWTKAYIKANKIAFDYLRGKPEATKYMAELAKYNVYTPRTEPVIEDIRRASGEGKRTKAGEIERKIMEAYALLDMRFKAAAWEARTEDLMRHNPNMTLEQAKQKAAERIRRTYPYAPATPPLVAGLANLPTGDYITYSYQALRGKVNSLRVGIEDAKQGDPRSLRGWIETQLLEAIWKTGKYGVPLWAALHKIIRQDKDVDDATPLDDEQIEAVRKIQMWYDKSATQWMWKEKRKGGEERIYYTITAGQTADPTSEIIAGAIQANWSGDKKAIVTDIAKNIARNYAGGGMYAETLYKFLTGDEPMSPYERKGLIDVMGKNDFQKDEIIERSLSELAIKFGTGRMGTFIQRYLAYKKAEQSGKIDVSGDYRSTEKPKDIAGSSFRLIRTKYIDKEKMSGYLRNLISQEMRGIKTAEQFINTWERNKKPDADLHRATEAQQYRFQMIKNIKGILDNYKKLGVKWFSDDELVAIMKDAGNTAGWQSPEDIKWLIIQNQLNEIDPYIRKKEYQGTELQKVQGIEQ